MLGKFNALNWGIQFALMLALAGAAIWGFDYMFLTATAAETKAKNIELEKLRSQNQQVTAVKNRLADFKSRYEQLKGEYEQTKQLLPEAVEISRVLEQVQLLGKDKLKVKTFEPQDEQQKDFYRVKPIKIEIGGTYPKLQDFFQRVSDLRRIVNVTDVEIKAAQQQRDTYSLDASFIISALYAEPEDVTNLKPAEPKKAEAAKPGAAPAKQ
ncbi:MAG TPA: type 4a pilus biogenesis protein PilO [Blastocatellia bacterium]|nr:type 4a pilus biogenesis protein PilO [Blastocatellia bacterium]